MVIWSQPAKIDLKGIHDYIARDSKYYATEVTDTIIEKTITLEEFPKIGRPVPEIMNENIREIFVYSYRVIYEIINKDVTILTVVHSKIDLKKDDLSKS